MTKLLKNNDVFVTYPQGQNQRKTKKYAGKYAKDWRKAIDKIAEVA